MRTLVLEYINTPVLLETSLEVALSCADQGDVVRYIHLGKVVPDLEEGPPGTTSRERNLIATSKTLSILTGYRQPFEIAVELAQIEANAKKLDFTADVPKKSSADRGIPYELASMSIEGLRKLQFEGIDIGTGIVSSLITRSLDPNPDVEQWSEYIKDLYSGCVEAIIVTRELLSSGEFDRVVVFNGRVAIPYAITRVCEEFEIPTFFHEVGGFNRKNYFFFDWQPHDTKKFGSLFREQWKRALSVNSVEATNLAVDFYQKKRQGENFAGKSFTRSQDAPWRSPFSRANEAARLPTIVYFSSSDDEYESVGKFRPKSVFDSQREAVRFLVDLANRGEFELIVRVHPHLMEKAEAERHWWDHVLGESANQEYVCVVPSSSKTRSYELLDHADVVVTWHSTIGAEAVFSGKKSIGLCESVVSNTIDEVLLPESTHELRKELTVGSLGSSSESESALAYAYGSMTFGFPYRRYVAGVQSEFLGTSVFRLNLRSLLIVGILFLKRVGVVASMRMITN